MKIKYIERGQGTPLVFIHGSLSDYRSWAFQLDFFSKHFRTIALTLNPFCPQSLRGVENKCLISHQAHDISVFLKHLNAGPVHLAGHSRGGALALILAARHPELFHTLILADPAPLDTLLPKEPAVLVELKKRNRFIMAALDQIKQGKLDNGLEIFTDGVSYKGFWKKLAEADKQIRRENALSLKSLPLDGKVPFTLKDTMNLDMPVLLVSGEKSPCLYGMMHNELEAGLKFLKKTIISNASHGMHRDNPDEFNIAVFDFLMTNNTGKHRSDNIEK